MMKLVIMNFNDSSVNFHDIPEDIYEIGDILEYVNSKYNKDYYESQIQWMLGKDISINV